MRMAAPATRSRMFDRYARGGRSLQVATKGHYWAGRAARSAGQLVRRRRAISSAPPRTPTFLRPARARAARPHGRRPGRPAVVPGQPQRSAPRSTTSASSAPCALLGQQGQRADQSRSFALRPNRSTPTPSASSPPNWRADRPPRPRGVDRASARNDGLDASTCAGFPTLPRVAPGGRIWSMVHGISAPGKPVRPRRDQPCRRARDDAADARHRARASGQDRHRLRRSPPDQRSQLQRHARLAPISSACSTIWRQLSARGRELQCRRRAT